MHMSVVKDNFIGDFSLSYFRFAIFRREETSA